jgi:hypothetical protein
VCCGAVTMGIRSETVISRISKRTYGISTAPLFKVGVHPHDLKIEGDSGELRCRDVFNKFVSRGEEIRIDDCVKKSYKPIKKSQSGISVDIFSTACPNPKYVTDPGVKREGSFEVACPSYHELGFWPSVEVSMFFGRTEIQVSAVAENFNGEKKEMLPIKFDEDPVY